MTITLRPDLLEASALRFAALTCNDSSRDDQAPAFDTRFEQREQ